MTFDLYFTLNQWNVSEFVENNPKSVRQIQNLFWWMWLAAGALANDINEDQPENVRGYVGIWLHMLRRKRLDVEFIKEWNGGEVSSWQRCPLLKGDSTAHKWKCIKKT
jgi:hypothetical protein